MAQAWLQRRFASLKLSDFQCSVYIYGIADLEPPADFRGVWGTFDVAGPLGTPSDVLDIDAVLIFSDPWRDTQRQATFTLLTYLVSCGEAIPPLYWVPHADGPDVDLPEEEPGSLVDFTQLFMEYGLDAVIDGDQEGMDLVSAVRIAIQQSELLARVLDSHTSIRRRIQDDIDAALPLLHDILWIDLVARLAPNIPAVDFSLPRLAEGETRIPTVPGFITGDLLGRGSFCTVHALKPLKSDGGPGDGIREVLKVVDKTKYSEPEHIRTLGRIVNIMIFLSSDELRHPNVAHIVQVYHLETHLCFREPYLGPENLFQRLKERQKVGPQCRPLSFDKTLSLMLQLGSAVCHIHTKASTAHRDIKPENIIVWEKPDILQLKLTDFDLAVVQQKGARCRRSCGTVPFIAPEVLADQTYDGLAADIWSEGIVLVEVLCNTHVVESSIISNFPRFKGRNPHSPETHAETANMIRSCFASPSFVSRLVEHRCRDDLQDLVSVAKPLLDGMCNVHVPERFTSAQVSESMQEWQVLLGS